MTQPTTETTPAPAKIGPIWQNGAFIAAATALVAALAGGLNSYANTKSQEKGSEKADYGYDAIRAVLEQHSELLKKGAEHDQAQDKALAELVGRLQLSAPESTSPTAPAPVPTVVMTLPGTKPLPRRTLKPLASALPPVPSAAPPPAPARLPKSLDQLLPEE